MAMENIINEEWRPLTEINPSYEVSSNGRVRHTFKNGHIKYLSPAKRDMRPSKNYLYVEINQRKFYVHRLVAMAFLPDWDPNLQVDHINLIQIDNRASNLRMCTGKQNCQFYQEHMRKKEDLGEDFDASKTNTLELC